MELILKNLSEQNNQLKVIPDSDKKSFLEDLKSTIIGNGKMMDILKNNPSSIVSGALSIYNAGLSFAKYKEQAYIIPYGKVAQVQVSYKGYQKLFNKGNPDFEIYIEKIFDEKTIKITGLNKGDFEIMETETKQLTLADFEKYNTKEPIAFAGYIRNKNTKEIIYKELWTSNMLKDFSKKFSQNSWEDGKLKSASAWGSSFNEMAEKTITKSLIRKSFTLDLTYNEKLTKALEIDQASVSGDNINYVDGNGGEEYKQDINCPPKVEPFKTEKYENVGDDILACFSGK